MVDLHFSSLLATNTIVDKARLTYAKNFLKIRFWVVWFESSKSEGLDHSNQMGW
jgi:hypothetical protein